MSEIAFPIKDLSRRKQQTSLTVLGLTITTAATIFLIIFGSNLGFEVSFLARGGRLNSGFYNIFFQFILTVSILNLIIGPIITSFLVHLTMSERMQDIGVMKASGCLSGSIFAYFITTFIACFPQHRSRHNPRRNNLLLIHIFSENCRIRHFTKH